MRSTNGTSRESGLPRELQSTERPVRLTTSGVFVLSCAAGLLTAALWLPVFLYTPAKEDAAAGTEAEVVEVTPSRGRNSRVPITYRYAVNGIEYSSRVHIRGREAGRFPIGSRVPVEYLISDPGKSWISGKRPRSIPVWFIFLIPPVLLPIAGGLLLLIRRQARLLSEGRATMATVKKSEQASTGESTTWRVTYEWTLLSGAKLSGRYDAARKTQPAAGTAIPIIYDRDSPQRHARYPFALVHIPGASPQGASHRKSRRRHAA